MLKLNTVKDENEHMDDDFLKNIDINNAQQNEQAIKEIEKRAVIIGRDFKGKTSQIDQAFSNIGVSVPVPEKLPPSVLPDTRRYKILRKMLKLFSSKNDRVKNWRLAQCIKPKLTQKDYGYKKKEWDGRIKNRERVLRKIIKPFGSTIHFKSENSQLVSLKQD